MHYWKRVGAHFYSYLLSLRFSICRMAWTFASNVREPFPRPGNGSVPTFYT